MRVVLAHWEGNSQKWGGAFVSSFCLCPRIAGQGSPPIPPPLHAPASPLTPAPPAKPASRPSRPPPARLTRAVGLPLAALPLEPPLGAALLAACARFGCADHLVLLCGLLSVPSIWGGGGGVKARDAAAARFAVAEGDFVTALNAHRAWAENGRSHKWWAFGRRRARGGALCRPGRAAAGVRWGLR